MSVLARRVIVVSPDAGPRATLAAALEQVAEAELLMAASPAGAPITPEAALCVLHLGGALAAHPAAAVAELGGSGPVLAVMPGLTLAAAVALLQASPRVVAVLAEESVGEDPGRTGRLASRILLDDVLGLEPELAPGAKLHEERIGDARERAQCLARIAAFAEQAGAPPPLRAPIEQCADELTMNALYDAPVDARGQPVFAGVPPRVRATLRTAQQVTVQYGRSGRWLVIAVRDAFGALGRDTVLRHLYKGLHGASKVSGKAGGAGLGMYLVASAAAAVELRVLPGIATEVRCWFDLDAPVQRPQQLDFLVQRDARGQARTGPARALRAVPRPWGRYLAALAVAGGVAAGAVVLAQRGGGGGGGSSGDGAVTADAPRPVATLEIDSDPSGAAVEIDGAAQGSTPLTLTSLPPGAEVSAAFRKLGYRPAAAQLRVPALGSAARHVQKLERSDNYVQVRFASTPPGAEVLRTGEASTTDRTYTPAELFVEAGQEQRFTLTMPGHVPLVLAPFTPEQGAAPLEKGGALVPGATLRIEAAIDGKIAVAPAPHCRELALPADCVLAPGTYTVEYMGPRLGPLARTVVMTASDATVRLELGLVEAPPGSRLEPGGLPRAALPAGPQTVLVAGPGGSRRVTVRVVAGATVIAR